MNAGNEKAEPNTDLELSLDYSNQRILKNDSGAGANAASRVDMTFVAASPLSELVWSPDTGLSLKCADSSFADKKTSPFRDVGPSNMVLASNDKLIDDVFAKPIAAVCIKSNSAGTDTPTKLLTSDSGVMAECKKYEEHDTGSNGNMEEMSAAEKIICGQVNTGIAQISGVKGDKVSTVSGKDDKMQSDNFLLQADEPKSIMEQNILPRDRTSRGRDVGIGNQALDTDDVSSAKVYPIIEHKGSGAPGLKSSGRSPFEKLESTAENDLRTFNCGANCGATSRILVSRSNEIENKSQDDEAMLKNLPVLHSPRNRRIRKFRNEGKERALSDEDIDVKFTKEEDESHESVESCTSAGLFLTGKKRLNFQQQLMVGSKRVKRQIQETSVSKSLVKHDSSFMNWILNMMNGFSQSIQEATSCLAHTLAYADQGHQWSDQKLITFNRDQDPEPKNTGFQSIFQSIYCPNLLNDGRRTSSANHQVGEDSKTFDLGNKVHGIDATPMICYAENDSLYKKYLHSNETEGSRGRYQVGPSSQPKIKPINFVESHESSKNNLVENKNYSNLGLGKEKEGMTSNSSSSRQQTNNTENIDSYALPERKDAVNISRRSDTRGSLWITRLFPKSTAPLNISDHLNWSAETQFHSTDCSRLPHPHMHTAHSNKSKIEETREQSADERFLIEAKELQICSINKEVSAGTMNDKVNNDHKSVHKFNSMSHSPRFRNKEPVASMFARRLDAIKHTIASNRTDSTNQETLTCLFCGTRGHQLCGCSEIAGNELQDLLKKMNSYVGLEKQPCLCIKCFQPNHWTISCPTSIARRKHELKVNVSVNDCSPSLRTGDEDQLISGCAINDEIDPQTKRNLNLKRESNEIITSEKIWSNASIKKYFGSNSEESNLKENPMTSPCIFVQRQISDVPGKIYDAVKKLRFSRTDILKWINSRMSMTHLDGFFLRLRLGKWEEGLGGTGYYVASITEAHRRSSQQNTRKSVCVNVGGIKCIVESRYISNHDFLEEEIMAWWCTTSKASGNIPSEKDLMEMMKKKKMLGF